MSKLVNCKRCGVGGLVWNKSAKGNWYLAFESMWYGDMGGHKTILPAHRCRPDDIDSFTGKDN
jgi:hypothetical protein